MIIRFFGVLLIFVGFLILKYFPDISGYQKKEMTLSGILIGIVIILIGIGLIIFG
jgi:hypothetical protein